MAEKKKAARKMQPVEVGDFVLQFPPKYERALNELKKAGNTEPTQMEILVEYDKQGGRITYNGETVKMGSFWDFDKKKPKDKPTPKVIKKREVVEEEVEMDVPVSNDNKETAKKTAKKTTKKTTKD